MNKIIQALNGERALAKFPDFNPGDTVVVQVKVVKAIASVCRRTRES